MTNPLDLQWPACLVPRAEAPAVQRKIRAALGFVPRSVEYTGCVPWAAEIDRLATLMPLAVLDRETGELGALACTHANTCRHCYGATRAAMLLLGYSGAQVDALSDRMYSGAISARIQASSELIRKMVNLDATCADLEAVKAAGFTDAEVAELAVVACLGTMYTRLATPLAIPNEAIEGLQKSFFAPVIGFFLRRGVGGKKAAWRGKQTSTAQLEGPLSKVLVPLLPGPAAGELRGLIDACLASEACPRRARLLAMMVVARGANDLLLEAELRALLGGESAELIDSAITRLDGEGLDSLERVLLHYARDSVRYWPGDIQKRAGILAAGRAPAVVVDAIGAVAVANGLARLAVLRAR